MIPAQPTTKSCLHLSFIGMFCALFLYCGPTMAQTALPDIIDRKMVDSLMAEIGNLSQQQRDSLLSAIIDTYSVDELVEAEKLQDSLFGHGERKRLFIYPDKIKNELLIKPVQEMRGASIYMTIPNDWKEIDPFARGSMVPKLPKRYLPAIPDYAIFTKGLDGYYFALAEMGYYGYFIPDTIQAKAYIHIPIPEEKKVIPPNLYKALGLSKNVMVILAVILQALLL